MTMRWILVAGACCALACSDAPRTPGLVASVEPEETAPAASEPAPAAEIAPAPPQLSAVPADVVRVEPKTPIPKPRARAQAKVITADPAGEVHVPLESLLRAPQVSSAPSSKPADLDPTDDEPLQSQVPPPFGSLERWKDRVHVERRSEAIGRSGAKQGTYTETDASLRVPVDKSVSLEGGVRVDSRSDPGAEKPERESIPRVGVEVRF